MSNAPDGTRYLHDSTTFKEEAVDKIALLNTDLDLTEGDVLDLKSKILLLTGNLTSFNEDLNSKISIEISARTSADGALSSLISTIQSKYIDSDGVTAIVNAKIVEESSIRANADGVLGYRLGLIEADYVTTDSATNIAKAKVAEEAAIRLSKDEALASRLLTVESSYVTTTTATNIATTVANAKVSDEAIARTSAIGAEATRVNTLLTTYASKNDLDIKVNAEVTSRNSAISTAVGAEATRVDTLLTGYTTTGAVDAKISSEVTSRNTAISNALGAEATRVDGLFANYSTTNSVDSKISTAVNAEVTNRNQAIVTAVGAQATRIDSIIATYETKGGVDSKIQAEVTSRNQAISSAINAEATRVDQVLSSFSSSGGSASGGNFLQNTSFVTKDGWDFQHYPGTYQADINLAGDDQHPIGENVLSIHQEYGVGGTGFGEWASDPFPVTAGTYIQFYTLGSSHRCDAAIGLAFYDQYMTALGETPEALSTIRGAGGKNPAGWEQFGSKSTLVPANAACARFFYRKKTTLSGSDSYGWFWRPYVGVATSAQTVWNPYVPGNDKSIQVQTLAKITNEATTRASAIGAEATRVDSMITRFSNNNAAEFGPGTLTQWSASNNPLIALADDANLYTGFSTDNSSVVIAETGLERAIFSLSTIPVDTSKRYRMSARVAAYSPSYPDDATIMYIGFVGLDGKGNVVDHGPTYQTYRYSCMAGQALYPRDGMQVFEKIVAGEGNDSILKFPPGTKQIRLVAILNYVASQRPDSARVKTLIDYIRFVDCEGELKAIDASAQVVSERNARVTAVDAEATRVDGLLTSYATKGLVDTKVNAEVTDRNSAISNAVGAEANRVNSLLTTYSTNTNVDQKISAEVTSRDNAISNAVGSEASRVNILLAGYVTSGALTTKINAEVTDRNSAISSAVGAEATRVNGLLASYETTGSVNSKIQAEVNDRTTAITNAVGAEATRVNNLLTGYTTGTGVDNKITVAVNAEVTNRNLAISNAVQGEATRVDGLLANYTTIGTVNSKISAAIYDESIARAQSEGALASRISTTSAAIGNSLNPNGRFTLAYTGGVPQGWSAWPDASNVGQLTTSNQTGRNGTIPLRVVRSGNQNVGVQQSMGNVPAGWYVVETEVQMFNGNWQGSGVYINFQGRADYKINFGTDADVADNVHAGSSFNRRSWSRLVYNSAQTDCSLFLMGGWNGFTFDGSNNETHWHSCSIRLANDAEIKAGKADTSLNGNNGLVAKVTVQEQAISTLNGKTQATWQVTADAGNNRAQLTVKADAYGNAGVDIVGDVAIKGQNGNGRTVISGSGVQVFDNNGTLRVRLGLF